MKINIIYPQIEKKKIHKNKFIKAIGMFFILASLICILINFLVKGKPWSLIVCLGLIMLWIFVFSRTLIEYNRTDQFIKLLSMTCLLLHFIDIFFSRGFGIFVIPIVLFSGILFSSILLFTDLESQKKNIFPVYILLIFSLTISILALSVPSVKTKWVYIVLLSVSVFYIFITSFVIKYNIFTDIKKRFSIK